MEFVRGWPEAVAGKLWRREERLESCFMRTCFFYFQILVTWLTIRILPKAKTAPNALLFTIFKSLKLKIEK